MEFKEKVVLITGAASGIGKAAAIAFAKEGAKLLISDRNEAAGKATEAELKKLGAVVSFCTTDVSVFAEVEQLVQQTVNRYGQIDIAINNAGIPGASAKTADYPIDDFEKVMQVNTAGVFYGMKAQLPQMVKQGKGVIINTASIAGLKGLPNSIAYTASKHAVVGMTKTTAMEYGKQNIRVNAICPVFTVTPLFNPDLIEKVAPGIPEKLKANVPMKRFAEVQEQVDAMLWLASDKASFVTGVAFPVDGGLTA